MSTLDAIIAASERIARYKDLTGTNSAIAHVLETQGRLEAISHPYKNITDWIEHNNLSAYRKKLAESTAIFGLAQAIQKNAASIMPSQTARAIDLLLDRQNQLFRNPAITTSSSPFDLYTRLQPMYVAVQGITASYLNHAIRQSRWNLIDEFEEINNEAATLAASLTDQGQWTDEQQSAFSLLIERIRALSAAYPKYGKRLSHLINIFIIWATCHMYYDFVQPKPEPLTQADLKATEQRLQHSMDAMLKEQKAYYLMLSRSYVYLRPTPRSMKLTCLPSQYKTVLLQTHHKWAYISYIDPADQLMHTGWVFKKYLTPAQ